MIKRNRNNDWGDILATVISKSKIEPHCRFIPDPEGSHSYQGALYAYEGVDFDIIIHTAIGEDFSSIKHLIIGLGYHLSYYVDVPEEALEKEYKDLSQKLNELTAPIQVGNIIEVLVSRKQFQENRSYTSTEFKYDPCLWKKDCLLYAPFGYERINYGDGRWTVKPEVKNFFVNSTNISFIQDFDPFLLQLISGRFLKRYRDLPPDARKTLGKYAEEFFNLYESGKVDSKRL